MLPALPPSLSSAIRQSVVAVPIRLGAAWLAVGALCLSMCLPVNAADNVPPAGFKALFNGKDLTGWIGLEHFDPRQIKAMTAEQWAAKIESNAADVKTHWTVQNGELVNDGHGVFLTTAQEYGDIELLIQYKTVPTADSGIYLRNTPQVQIWDPTEESKFAALQNDKGSGGLWNNSPGRPGKDPLVLADRPFGQWNEFRIVQAGARTWVWLNGQLVVDGAIMENFWDRSQPLPVKGHIQLQTHGGEIRWKNIFVRELPSAEANDWLEHGAFRPVFNGHDLAGWKGAVNDYEVVDGAVRCQSGKGGHLYTADTYGDFELELEIKLPPGGNNGLAIRYPGEGDPAYAAFCELQVLDTEAPQYKGLDPRQTHGSAYGMVPAARGYQRPIGEWNRQHVTVRGTTVKVELNGSVILDADIGKVTEFMANSPHPGKELTHGHFGFAGHNDPVEFRNIRIKRWKD